MSLSPPKSDLVEEGNSDSLAIRTWANHSGLSLSEFISARVVLPERKRSELLAHFPRVWNPEELTIWFNGSVFVVAAPSPTVPLLTNIGQLAREFLRETFEASQIWQHIDGIGPTPAHPEIYLLSVQKKPQSQDAVDDVDLPFIHLVEDDLFILEQSTNPYETVLPILLRDVYYALQDFYISRIENQCLYQTIDNVERLNASLGELLSSYFSLPPYRRLLDSTATDIRRCLAAMHSAIQRVAEKESEHRQAVREANKSFESAAVINKLHDYFREHMAPEREFNRDSQLTLMNFAAEETNNVVITQATLVAAMIGAIVGGILSMLGQVVFS
jgi:hypothetical protein